jgi:hypothetical protein
LHLPPSWTILLKLWLLAYFRESPQLLLTS